MNCPHLFNELEKIINSFLISPGTSVIQVMATDQTNARLFYSILEDQPYFSVEPTTGIAGYTYLSNTNKQVR